jgi:GNAT superfamily N-acetyltransferase
MPFKIQTFQSDHHSFVVDSWLRSLRDACYRDVDADIFYPEVRVRVHSLLKRPGVSVRVAVKDDDPDTYVGWAAVEGDVLHYVYVKQEARRLGVAKTLLGGLELHRYSHKPRFVTPPRDWTYNPFLGVLK